MPTCPHCAAESEPNQPGVSALECPRCGNLVGLRSNVESVDSFRAHQPPSDPYSAQEVASAPGIELAPGDEVLIESGPFRGYRGTVDDIFPALRQARVVVTIFGRASPVDLWVAELRRI